MNTLLIATLAYLASIASAAPSGYGVESVVEDPSRIVTDVHLVDPYENYLQHGNKAVPVHLGLTSSKAVNVEPAIGLGHGTVTSTAGGGSIAASPEGVIIKDPRTVPVLIVGPSGTIYAEGLWGPTDNIGGNGVHVDASHIGLGHGYAS